MKAIVHPHVVHVVPVQQVVASTARALRRLAQPHMTTSLSTRTGGGPMSCATLSEGGFQVLHGIHLQHVIQLIRRSRLQCPVRGTTKDTSAISLDHTCQDVVMTRTVTVRFVHTIGIGIA